MNRSTIARGKRFNDAVGEPDGDTLTEIVPSMPTAAEHLDWSPILNGPGACSVSGCTCQAYEGSEIVTGCQNQNCRHRYSDHSDT